MYSNDPFLGKAIVFQGEHNFFISENAPSTPGYDLDLIYVECRLCGSPVLWGEGRTSRLIHASGMDASLLDSSCLILSEGCPQCKPNAPVYHLHVVRVATLSPEDLILLGPHKGSA